MTDQTAQLLEQNLRALGPNANERIERVKTWLRARGRSRMADLLDAYPAAPLVEDHEEIMLQFANRGADTSSQSHRETQANQDGKIAGFSEMNFQQRRVAQMAERAKNDPNYATGGRRE